MRLPPICSFFFFNDTATTEIYTLSLHDALPICSGLFEAYATPEFAALNMKVPKDFNPRTDRKSTRLNSSHLVISYAVFCLKKKKTHHNDPRSTLVKNSTFDINPRATSHSLLR